MEDPSITMEEYIRLEEEKSQRHDPKRYYKDGDCAIMLRRPRYVVPTGRVLVLTSRYVVPTGRAIVATGRDHDRLVTILPLTTAEEHIVVQRESKARTTLLQSILDDHVVDFYYMDDARDIWNAVKARFGGNAESKKTRKSMLKQEFSEFRFHEEEGLHKGYDRMQKILSHLNQLKAKQDAEDINLKFLRALPSSWSQVALTLKTKGGLEFLSFNDLYYKLKTLEVDVKGYNTFPSSQSIGPSHSAFVSATSTSKKMSCGDSPNYSSTTTYSVPSNSKTGSHRSDLKHIKKLDLEEMDLKWQMAMLFVRVYKFEQKAERKIDFDKKESARFNKQKVKCYKCQQIGHFAREYRAKGGNDKQRYSSFKIKEIEKKEEDSKALITVDTLVDWTKHDSESDGVIAAKEFGMIAGCDSKDAIKEGAAKLYNLITGANSEEANTAGDAGEFALMGVTSELTLEDKIRVLSIELENTSNLLKHSERINADVETAKKDLQTKLDNHLARTKKWRNSSKNLFKLIDSSMSVITKVGLGFTNCISENELGWDDSAFSVFTTNSKDVEGRPIFHRFAKTNSKKVVPPPLTGDYTSLSDHSNLDESQMSYGTKSSTSSDSKSMFNDFVSCDDNDKSLEVNPNDFASSDSSLKSSEHKPTDSTSCASTSSVSTSMIEVEIESNVGTPIKEPISVILGNMLHLFLSYVLPQPVPTGTPKVKPVPTGKPKVKPVPTGKPKVLPVSTATEDEEIFYSGCSRSMTGNKEQLDDFQAFHGRKVTFGGGEGRITGKGIIHTPTLDFENVYYVKELQQFNLGNLACLVAHASFDESVKWHRQIVHVNYKNMNRLVKGNLVRGLPSKLFKNGHTCVACCKGKQHKASYKAINAVSSISEPLQLLYMDLFGPTSIRSIDYKYYCLVITDDYSRFCWVFFLEHKDETYPILKNFINLVENQLNKKREYSNPRTPQQNRAAERKNKTLIEAAKTMLADCKLPTMFWTEAVRTACYVLNRVSVTSPHNKTPYALLTRNIPFVSHFKPFGCHVTILNTSDHLVKFDGKANEGYIVGYSASNKAYRGYNVPNKRVEESMNLWSLEEKPNVQGLGHEWYFDLDYLTDSLGYKNVSANQPAGTQGTTTHSAGTQDADSDSDCDEQVIIVPSYPSHIIQGTQPIDTPGDTVDDSPFQSADEIFQKELARLKNQEHRVNFDAESLALGTTYNTNLPVPSGSIPVPAAFTIVPSNDVPVHTSRSTDSMFDGEPTTRFPCPSNLGNHNPSLGIFSSSSYDDEFDTALNNDASSIEVSKYAIGTKWILKNKRDARGIVFCNKARLIAQGHRQEEGIDYDEVFSHVARIEAIRLFLAFASYMGFLVYQMDVRSAFLYGRIDEEVYVTQPKGFMDPQHPKKVYMVVKALYGLHQVPRAWYATLSTFLLKHSYRSDTIDKTLFLKKNNKDIIPVQVYVDDIIFGSTKKAWFTSSKRPDGIFIHQEKYVQEILNKFDLGSVKTETTPYEATKLKFKNEFDNPVNVHLYRSMIGSLMYLTASRPDIMFALSACSRHQVTPTTSNLEAIKKIFKYLKGQPKLGLWYPKESPLVLEAYSDSDYAGPNKDRKSTTGECQFLGRRLISWQCKKQTIVATSSTEAEYVAAANCCGQVFPLVLPRVPADYVIFPTG
nr:putative ribonuclease H-like domain-containing protein [Tanacetum cinerariifolium]